MQHGLVLGQKLIGRLKRQSFVWMMIEPAFDEGNFCIGDRREGSIFGDV
jgi:hypothetical protein